MATDSIGRVAKPAKVYDWYIKHKGKEAYVTRDGFTSIRSRALFHTGPRKPYTKASDIKQSTFAQRCPSAEPLSEADFLVEGGYNERYPDDDS